MSWLPLSLDSRCRGNEKFSKEAAKLGTLGYSVEEFAKRHEDCVEKPEIVEEIPGTNIKVVDRRRFRCE